MVLHLDQSDKQFLKRQLSLFFSQSFHFLIHDKQFFSIRTCLWDTMVGYYSAAEKLYQAYNQLLSPFTGVLFPHIAKSRDVLFFKKIFYRITFTNLFCVAAALLLASYVLDIVYGTRILIYWKYSVYSVTACFVTIPSMLLGYPFLAAMGHPLYTNYTVMTTSVVHITGLVVLYIYGAISPITVAMMVVMSETLLILFRIWGVRRFRLFQI